MLPSSSSSLSSLDGKPFPSLSFFPKWNLSPNLSSLDVVVFEVDAALASVVVFIAVGVAEVAVLQGARVDGRGCRVAWFLGG